MSVPQIFESEYRFCLILWEHEPVNSTQLVHLCQEQLGWSGHHLYRDPAAEPAGRGEK